MKKKIMTVLLAAMFLSGAAQAMDSETLLKTPTRYPVLYADGKARIYADMETISAMQTMDYPGSIENVSFTLYVENYKKNADAFDFARGNLVKKILEYKAELAADWREKHYEMTLTPVAVYNAKGEKQSAEEGKNKLKASAKELYYNLSHVLKSGK